MDTIDRRLDALRRSAQQSEQDLASFALHPREHAVGTDASGLVRIDWDHGGPHLSVGEGWEHSVAAEDLPAAVSEAMTNVLADRYSRDALRNGDEKPEELRAHLDDRDLGSSLGRHPEFAAAIRRPDFRERLRNLLADAARRASARRHGAGPARIVGVVLDHAGDVSGFTIDPAQAGGRRGAAITADAAAAVADARTRFSSPDPMIRPLTDADVIGVLTS